MATPSRFLRSLSAYRRAMFLARIRLGQIEEATARRLSEALDDFADLLAEGFSALPAEGREGAEAAAQIVRLAADELQDTLERAVGEGRRLAFDDTLTVWERAMRRVAAARGVPDRLLGAVRSPALTMAGQFDAVGSAATWRTLLRERVANAEAEAAALVRQALLQGTSPDELARRLRRYVAGSEGFDRAFDGTKIDLRRVPVAQRGAAEQMRYNAERIAFTEYGNARAEAEIQHFGRDPFVGAVQWTLSPDRGRARVPDECDLLAAADWYGLGPGVFPVGKVPPKPHPFDRCELMPVARRADELAAPKPDPDRVLRAERARIPGEVSKERAERIRAQAEAAVRFGEEVHRATQDRAA